MGFRFLRLRGAGDLKSTVQLQSPNPTRDPQTNQAVPNWTTVTTVHAEIKPISGSEIFQGQATMAETKYLLGCRRNESVAPNMRWSVIAGPFNGVTMDINSVFDPDGKQRWTVCECERGQS